MGASRRVAGAVALLTTTVFAVGAVSAASAPTQPDGVESQPKGVPGARLPNELRLWTYNTATGKYVVVKGDASQPYVKRLRKPPAGTTIAYQDPWAANPFAIPIRNGVYQVARKLGFKVIYCDSAFKTDKAVECAELLAGQKPDFTILGNWQGGAAKAVMAVYDKARIPAVSMDVSHPNAIFFGANNYTSGRIGGVAAGRYARSKWACKDTWVFLGENKEEGAAADQRLTGFADGVQQICGRLPKSNIQRQRMAEGTGEQALTVTTDWLTAHPQAKHVVSTTLDDERSSGIAKAFQSTRRDGQVVGLGCDAVGIEVVKQAPASKNHYLGCVAFFPERYAPFLVSIALDVLARKPVPNEAHLAHIFLTNKTIRKIYP